MGVKAMSKFFNCAKKRGAFFEGWYFKHAANGNVLCFIPGVSRNKKGEKTAFLQIILNGASYMAHFGAEAFFADEKSETVYIGKNVFSKNGASLDIQLPALTLSGHISYGAISPYKKTPYSPTIMGPFSYFKNLQCNHGVLSMGHTLNGTVTFNGQQLCFGGGRGYIEKDWGTSFPANWFWLQCNTFNNADADMVLAAATVPFLGKSFKGVLFALTHNGKHYNIATYYGARIVRFIKTPATAKFAIKQGRYTLLAEFDLKTAVALKAPKNGEMNKRAVEAANTTCKIKLFTKTAVIFEGQGTMASGECMI